MDSCRDIDPLATRVADGEATRAERQHVEGHVLECPPCRRSLHAQRQARNIVRDRTESLVEHAPFGLRARCASMRDAVPAETRRERPFLSGASWPVALAASLLLAIAGAAMYGLVVNPSKAVAAQLTLDHLKCFTLFEQPAGLRPIDVQAALHRLHGIELMVPDVPPEAELTLVGGRECLYLDGSVTHLLYRRGTLAVSLFVLPPGEKLSQTGLDVLGHSAVAFMRGGRTWVVLARVPHDDVRRMASAFGAASE
jgi:anti-sigma factor RsiW